jgi:hypothetical protein
MVVDHSVVSMADPDHLKPVIDGRACDAPDGCIHPGRITTRGKHTHRFDFSHVDQVLDEPKIKKIVLRREYLVYMVADTLQLLL